MSESLPDGSTVQLDGIYRDADPNPLFQGGSPALVPPLTIGPGQQFTVKLVRELAPLVARFPLHAPSPGTMHLKRGPCRAPTTSLP